MKIFLHTKDQPDEDWRNGEYTVTKIPAVGEYVVTSESSEWYLVTAVVHMLFADEEFDAEVFAVLTSQVAAIAKAGKFPV